MLALSGLSPTAELDRRTRHESACTVTPVASAVVRYGRVNLTTDTVAFGTVHRLWVRPQAVHSGLKTYFFANPLFGFLLPVRRYVGTAVSRLRRPCLSLRLLLYSAISSRAEVAGGEVCISASGLAVRPGKTSISS